MKARVTAVITVRPDTPQETQRQFWSTFYEEELLGGAKIAQALNTSQRRLASDGYRAAGLGRRRRAAYDWFCFNLYLGERDPLLCLRPPVGALARVAGAGPFPPAALVASTALHRLHRRGRDLLVLERLLEERPPSSCGVPAATGKPPPPPPW
ncbi:MAG: hypothetical protein IPI57_07270 [Candidatus Competibacteraceae bacterium]|nr:hypothetical protein [Candidatus Competibacteraceae bacterium]